jgi:hypothetical protein
MELMRNRRAGQPFTSSDAEMAAARFTSSVLVSSYGTRSANSLRLGSEPGPAE